MTERAMGVRAIWIPFLAAVAAACSVGPDPAGGPDTPRAAQSTRPERGSIIGTASVERRVVWPDLDEVDLPEAGTLSPATREAVRIAPAPVLVPRGGDPLGDGRLFVGPSWWAYAGSADGVSLSIQASTRARLVPGVRTAPTRHRVRGVGALLTMNEGIPVISWIEHGVAYSLELECDATAARACRDHRVARALAESLVLVGGSGVTP